MAGRHWRQHHARMPPPIAGLRAAHLLLGLPGVRRYRPAWRCSWWTMLAGATRAVPFLRKRAAGSAGGEPDRAAHSRAVVRAAASRVRACWPVSNADTCSSGSSQPSCWWTTSNLRPSGLEGGKRLLRRPGRPWRHLDPEPYARCRYRRPVGLGWWDGSAGPAQHGGHQARDGSTHQDQHDQRAQPPPALGRGRSPAGGCLPPGPPVRRFRGGEVVRHECAIPNGTVARRDGERGHSPRGRRNYYQARSFPSNRIAESSRLKALAPPRRSAHRRPLPWPARQILSDLVQECVIAGWLAPTGLAATIRGGQGQAGSPWPRPRPCGAEL
jgi:hypothetical protein